MKVFIGWSGKRSQALANELKEWIPLIIQSAEPWVSDKDISAGERWAQKIAGELEASNFGILCVTPENLSSEWVLFEAGALSKAMQDAKVIPLLFGLELSDLAGPLSQFQASKVDEQGMLNVLKSINKASDTKTDEAIIDQLIPTLWPKLQERLSNISDKKALEKHTRTQKEVLEDLVSQVRGLGNRMRDFFDPDMMEQKFDHRNRRHRSFEPRMFDEMIHIMIHSHEFDMSLLLLAGFIREQMPWLAEVLIETHRELKTADSGEVLKIRHNLRQVITVSTQSSWGESMRRRGRGSRFLIDELPHFIEQAISKQIKNRHIAEVVEEVDKVKTD